MSEPQADTLASEPFCHGLLKLKPSRTQDNNSILCKLASTVFVFYNADVLLVCSVCDILNVKRRSVTYYYAVFLLW